VALELNKKEVAGRHEQGMMSSMLGNFNKHPDVARATNIGEPTMVDPTPTNPSDVVQAATRALGGGAVPGDNKATVGIVNVAPGPGQEPPRSDTLPANPPDQPAPAPNAQEQPPAAADAPKNSAGETNPEVADPNELKPNVAPDPNALPPLQQNNELATGSSSTSASSTSSQNSEELADISSSKKKKKKGLGKLNPF
jgi:outer membrane protein assembly factor BamD